MLKRFARWRAVRQLQTMTPEQSALLLKCVIHFNIETDPEIVAMIADKASEAAEGPGKAILEKVAASYREGREVKFGTYPAHFSTVTVDPAMQAEIEDALQGVEE